MLKSIRWLLIAALSVATPDEAAAQGGPLANRRALAVAVVPGGTSGLYDVHAAWTAELGGGPTSVPLDLGTELDLLVNGVQRDHLGVTVQADAGAGDCGTCSGGCGSGYVDGVLNTMICMEDGQGPTAGCDCRFPSILSSFPGQALQPGDRVQLVLSPSPGSLPDVDTADDVATTTFQGTPSLWNRSLLSVEVTPSPTAGDSFFDVWVEYALEASGPGAEWTLTPAVQLILNGTPLGNFEPPCGPQIAAPGSSCSLCDGSLCGVIQCDGQTLTELRCTPGDLGCGCVSAGGLLIPIPAIPLEPGDVLDVVLVPVPGALPELPGFGDDDEQLDVGRWLDLGQALAGTHGDPLNAGAGTLIGGDPVSLTLANALENSTAWLVAGVAELSAPFKGGVLVPDPSPPGFFVALPTGAAGTIGLAGVWPLGIPSGFISYYQWWIVDAAGPVGFAASNALSATAP